MHYRRDYLQGGITRQQAPTNVTSPERSAPIRVVIVEDHALVREGTAQLLNHHDDITVVGQAGSAEQALPLLERTCPDVVIVDVNLPKMNGLALAREITARFPEVEILIVSAYDDYAYVTEALEIGVTGYLLKTASARELTDAVRAAADGVLVLAKELSTRLAHRWQPGPGNEDPLTLTRRQADVLNLLVRGMSNKHIASELDLGLRTVEGHVSALLIKLGVTSRTEAALYALNHQLVTRDARDKPTNVD
ncbi:MAG: response regulator [Ferrimicrobium sp.]|uniref:Response regulator n=1 Tax=Ferrimicrobium acidiphilum TaxID=121039 RepID=A0ABV3Y1A8_9ACTN|nr:response regulator transcription factor [Ferrimicrobium sp.]